MKKDEVVNEFLRSANENGIISTLYGVFGKCIKVSIPFSQRACEMSVDDIVKHTGFCDKKQFYRIFKKATGITPGEFRRYGKK
jgi:AraC-like DNA-binding protein